MKKYSSITHKYLRGQKKRTLLVIIGITLSVALITAIGTMFVSIREKWIDDTIKTKGNYHVKFMEVEKKNIGKIDNNVDISNIAITSSDDTGIIAPVSKKERDNDSRAPLYRYLDISGYDSRALKMFPINIKKGRLPKNSNEIVLEYWVLDYFPGKPKIGDKIKLDMGMLTKKGDNRDRKAEELFTKTGQKEYTIVGINEPEFSWPSGYHAKAITFLDENNLPKNKKYNVYARVNSIKNVQEKSEKIAKNIGFKKERDLERGGIYRYKIQYNDDLLSLYGESIREPINKGLKYILIFIIILIIVSTIAVIYNIFNISVLERISQFGILRCMGASPKQIKKLVLKEAFTLSIVAIPLGLASGVMAMKIVIIIVQKLLNDKMKIIISPIVFMVSIILTLITTYLSAIGPAKKASRVSPVEAARNTGGLKKEKINKVKKSSLFNKILGVEGQIAYKNLKRDRKKFRITVFSLVISIVLYIVFGSFASFVFKIEAVTQKDLKDFVLWRNGRVDKEISESTCSEIEKLKDVEKVYKVMMSGESILVPEKKMNPKVLEMKPYLKDKKLGDNLINSSNILICYEDNKLPEFKKYLKEGSIDREKLNSENGVIIVKTNSLNNENTNKTAILDVVDFKVGDKIQIINEDNLKEGKKDIKIVKVLGILEKGILENDYNLNGGINLITTEKVYKNITGNNHIEKLFIQLKEGANKDIVGEYLKSLNKKDLRYQYVDFAAESKKERDRSIAINIFLYGFVAVITLIGCLNILNTINTNLMLRKRELSMIRAVGMDKRRMNKMIYFEGIYYAIIAMIYGSVIGVALSYKMFTIMNILREFEWQFPKKQILVASIGTIIISLVASYIPLRKINGGNIIENIRTEE